MLEDVPRAAVTLYCDPAATLDDLRKAVTMLEESAPIARRIFGGAHPIAVDIGNSLRDAQERLRTQ